jgi:hypothetical protein
LTIVAFLLQRDEAADESDHRVIPLQLDETAGNVTPHRLSVSLKLEAVATPVRLRAGSCDLTTRPTELDAGYRYPKLT